MKWRKKNTRRLLNCEQIQEYALKPYQGDEIALFRMEPTNVSVLAEESVRRKVESLKNVILALGDVELMALNSRESFEDNRQYLHGRQEEEENPILLQLLEEDLGHLNRIQMQMAAAREFLIGIRLKGIREKEIYPYLRRVEAAIRKEGFTVHRETQEEMKQLMIVYHTQNVTSDAFDDYDGKRWWKQTQ